MYVVMIASECAPVAKVRGLADVVYGLSRELELRGHTVVIVLPRYDCMRHDHVRDLHVAYEDLWVPWDSGAIRCTVWFGFVHGRRCLFVEPHSQQAFFDRGTYYGFWDDPQRFAFFSKAALEFLLPGLAQKPTPNIYTLDSILDLALARNPVVSSAEGLIDRQRGQQTAAGAYPNPTVTGYLGYGEVRDTGRANIRESLDRESLTEYNVNLGQPLEWPAMRAARQQVADAGLATANAGMSRPA